MPKVNLNIDWTDFNSVVQLATDLRCKTEMIVFHNGHNYQITHSTRESEIVKKGFVVVARVGRAQ
jgi:hypothetical protein